MEIDFSTQDPKYNIRVITTEEGDVSAFLVNAHSGMAVPPHEPMFMLRAKDRNAAPTIRQYRDLCKDADHQTSVAKRLHEFLEFTVKYPQSMKEPDTAP